MHFLFLLLLLLVFVGLFCLVTCLDLFILFCCFGLIILFCCCFSVAFLGVFCGFTAALRLLSLFVF